ncbi:MAG: hypothetical protein AMXMBFR80_19200 [Dehalococcoidia bacterium]|nr:hypothetical protein [Tepidiformaceae bacterium]
MRTENGITIDTAALEQLLSQADLVTIGFTLFPQRLLADTRSNATDGQWAGIVDPVASMQERYLWLGRNRGSFGPPQAFSFFTWPHTVRGMVERDVLRPLRRRLGPEADADLERALEQALELERRAIADAVRGTEAWPTLWAAAS